MLKFFFFQIVLIALTKQQTKYCSFSIQDNPDFGNKEKALGYFPKRVVVLDGAFTIYGGKGVNDAKLQHGASMTAQLLDNNSDGKVDDSKLELQLKSKKAWIAIFASESQEEELQKHAKSSKDFDEVQKSTSAVIYLNEMDFSSKGAGYWGKDNSVEEILHTINHVGHSFVYPTIFGFAKGSSKLTEAMDVARGGQFTTIPKPYPAAAWYTYDDATCDYDCMAVEYLYWGIVTNMGLRSDKETCDGIQNEWRPCTKEQLSAKDVKLYALINDPQYLMPTKSPVACQEIIDLDKKLFSEQLANNKSSESNQLAICFVLLSFALILIF